MWSTCSNNHMRNLDLECLENKPGQPEQDHNRYKNNPGQQWDADSQCQLLMFTSEARMDHGAHNLHEICHSLKCRAQVVVVVEEIVVVVVVVIVVVVVVVDVLVVPDVVVSTLYIS